MKKLLFSFALGAAFSITNVVAQCTAQATLNEDFTTFTTFPEQCWYGVNANPAIPTFSIINDGGNNKLQFYGFTNANGTFYFSTPELSNIDGNHFITFDAIGTSSLANGTKIQIGTLEVQNNNTTFVAHGSEIVIWDTVTNNTYSSINIPAAPTNKFVAFKITTNAFHQSIKFDNFKWESSVTTPIVCVGDTALNQNFNAFTAFPDSCWTASDPSPNFDLDDLNGDNYISFYSYNDASKSYYIATPELTNIDGTRQLLFDARVVIGSIKVQVGTIENAGDFSTFVAHGTDHTIVGNTLSTYKSIAIPATANHKHIALKFNAAAAHQAIAVDNIVWRVFEEEPPTSVSNIDANAVQLYPNPVNGGVLNIANNSIIKEVVVYDVTGKKVLTTQPNATNTTLNVADLNNGIYMVRVQTQNGVSSTAKFVKN